MNLFIGGYAQGKLEYVKSIYPESLVIDENNYAEIINFTLNESDEKVVNNNYHGDIIINHLHLIIREQLSADVDEEKIKKIIKKIINNYSEINFVCDEIGNGIVPIDAFERRYRDVTGHILIELARQAESVVRVVCGLPVRIK